MCPTKEERFEIAFRKPLRLSWRNLAAIGYEITAFTYRDCSKRFELRGDYFCPDSKEKLEGILKKLHNRFKDK